MGSRIGRRHHDDLATASPLHHGVDMPFARRRAPQRQVQGQLDDAVLAQQALEGVVVQTRQEAAPVHFHHHVTHRHALLQGLRYRADHFHPPRLFVAEHAHAEWPLVKGHHQTRRGARSRQR
jgi:hypothetical protein